VSAPERRPEVRVGSAPDGLAVSAAERSLAATLPQWLSLLVIAAAAGATVLVGRLFHVPVS
jgi:hypothetical protein